MDELIEEFGGDNGQSQQAFAAPPCASAPPATSEVSEMPSHWLERLTREEAFSKALDTVPDVLKALILDAAARWEMRKEPILVVLLHVLAGAAGVKHRMRRAHLGFSCPFNVVVCGDSRSRQNWLEFLSEPWLGKVRGRLRMNQAFGAKHFLNEAKSLQQQSGLAFGSVLDKERLLFNAHMTMAPCAMERSPLPGKLLEALKHSFGRTVVSLNSGMDPMAELHAAGRRQVSELCRVLEMSWRDMDLPGKGPIPRRGVIHLFWRAERLAAQKIVGGSASPWRELVPPVLLFREGPAPPYLVPLHAETFVGWEALLTGLIKSVEANHDAIVWTLSSEADSLVADFCRDLLTPSPSLPPTEFHHFSWFYELVIRLAMLLTILDRQISHGSYNETIVSVEAMDRACFLAWWLAHEHHECLNWLRSSCAVDTEDESDDIDGIDTIDIDRVRTAILERLAIKGPLRKRELIRTFHEMPAHVRDRALAGLKKQGLVTETADGRVTLPKRDGACDSKC